MFKLISALFMKKNPEIHNGYRTYAEAYDAGVRLSNSTGYGYGKKFTVYSMNAINYSLLIERI